MCSRTSNDIFCVTIGHVPETIIKGTTADTSYIAEFGYVPTYPDDKLVLGRYLEPAIDMGFALTANILIDNGQFICCLLGGS